MDCLLPNHFVTTQMITVEKKESAHWEHPLNSRNKRVKIIL